MAPSTCAAVRRRLLAWYDRKRRDLPWRTTPPNPYATLVSESMLQQTQVATVVPYFRRFIERFPTVESLAAADIDEVLPLWAGLGYYRRCHHLHAAAREIVERFGRTFPRDLGLLRSLPGVGAYSAGAIASIAFGVSVPAVDGNVRRVLSRLVGGMNGAGGTELGAMPTASRIRGRIRGKHSPDAVGMSSGQDHADACRRRHGTRRGLGVLGPRHCAAIATQLVPADRPGDFNQALMELGARVCVARSPRCAECPVAAVCRYRRSKAAARGAGRARPTPSPTGAKRTRSRPLRVIVTIAIRCDGMILYRKRPARGLWAGLWSWPEAEPKNGESMDQTAAALWRTLYPRSRRKPRHFHTLMHDLTHRRVQFEAFTVEIRDGRTPSAREHRWTREGDVATLAQSTAQRKLAAVLNSE